MLNASHVSRRFGSTLAVDGVSLQVGKGEIVGLLGPNGAGKSTIIRMLAGVLVPDSGQIDTAGTRPGYLPEGAPLYGGLTPRQSLHFLLAFVHWPKDQAQARTAKVLQMLDLEEHADQGVQELSKGYQRRTALALALANDPDAILLDEPFDGFDPIQKTRGRELLRSLAKDKSILVCTHSLEEAEFLCDRLLVLNHGKLIASGSVAELLKQTGATNFSDAFASILEAQT